eukprot:TRINITY_DN9197_c1_g2_i1.p1 TRINITY_DN9197_c1_g2~~TRINITY_DN9197_c1_g2_i1.p1  ORF type:complete len:329 (+),score=93.76 TRINITY_DN9197_c1_g2_i1:102-1088(+)
MMLQKRIIYFLVGSAGLLDAAAGFDAECRSFDDVECESFDNEIEDVSYMKLSLLQNALKVTREKPASAIATRFFQDAETGPLESESLEAFQNLWKPKAVKVRSSPEAEARLEAAQAEAEQAAAEAIAVDGLQKAEKAAAKAKAAWAKVGQAKKAGSSSMTSRRSVKEDSPKTDENDEEEEDDVAAFLESGKELSLAIERYQQVPGGFPDSNSQKAFGSGTTFSDGNGTGNSAIGPATSSTGNTTDRGSCDESQLLPCEMQRVITFDFRLSPVEGSLEFAGLLALWFFSIFVASTVCACGSSAMCCCQLVSITAIGYLGVATAAGWFHK